MTQEPPLAGPGLRDQPWPEEELEILGRCPVCSGAERTLLYRDLWDNVFFVAAGQWTMWLCGHCASAYLDPRPNQATIGLAYGRYYTHDAPDADEVKTPTTLLQRLRRGLGNGYRNHRYGTKLSPALRVGSVVAALLPPLRRPIDGSFRFLPYRPAAANRKVLDVGCGSGSWLVAARLAGWQAVGADPDRLACARAMETGIEVRHGGVEAWADEAGTFDAITMTHVIEHVHFPVDTLRAAHALLRPGGQLFVETPNLNALTHKRFGKDWRGLEPPRHLVLFNRNSLRDALRAAGYERIRFRKNASPYAWMTRASARIAAGADPNDESFAPDVGSPRLPFLAREPEFLTVTCERPRRR